MESVTYWFVILFLLSGLVLVYLYFPIGSIFKNSGQEEPEETTTTLPEGTTTTMVSTLPEEHTTEDLFGQTPEEEPGDLPLPPPLS